MGKLYDRADIYDLIESDARTEVIRKDWEEFLGDRKIDTVLDVSIGSGGLTLPLKVNMTKSKVDRPSGLKYLGFGFYYDASARQFKAKPHAKSVEKFKRRMKELTCRSWGVSNSYKIDKLNQLIRGWINYFMMPGSKPGMSNRCYASCIGFDEFQF